MLVAAFGADRQALASLMVGLMRRAAGDLGKADPADLFPRFGWALEYLTRLWELRG